MGRRFLVLLLLAHGAALFAAAPASTGPAARPNFLFVCTDDQRWDAMGVVQRESGNRARFPWLQTPNMDRLARDGVRFRNAFVVNALCSPSRASFLTGAHATRHGDHRLRDRLPAPPSERPVPGDGRLQGASR